MPARSVTRPHNYRTRFLVGTALAAILGVGLSSMLLANARRAVARERAERAAIIATLATKDIADRLWAKPDQLRAALERFAKSTDTTVRVVASPTPSATIRRTSGDFLISSREVRARSRPARPWLTLMVVPAPQLLPMTRSGAAGSSWS